ncbi:glycoside hydrolase family 3 N-terminal domain-containing protein [uncultured Odoribacter sp.]|uniref:glycoside hydrolase family 3 N-terminal domain-containing protein n=1 Tax=uncultured Odoribacter sp. TaxID=876416 RepID=UPI00261538FA|nr:glycoside hydrolase family 3 N-terminal domain-containing protein [uncultured Odoribacter sp.]
MMSLNKIFIIVLAFLFSFSTAFAQSSEAETWTDKALTSMSLEEKIGQLFMIAAYSNKDKDYEDQLSKLIQKFHVGGVIFFQGEPVRQAEMTNRFQKESTYPLWIGMDAEHGIGWRLQTAMVFPRMLIAGAVADDSLIFLLGARIARHCEIMGVHINFAPVADINNNPNNPVIGMRSFGEERENVYRKSKMYVEGSLSRHILPVVKHFPGHGDTDTDSHKALPAINHNRARLDSIELYPFKKLISQHIPALMIAHLNVNALDTNGLPASLSPQIIGHFLKDSLSYQGLCFTDALNMKGVLQGRETGEAEVEALMAGNDVLLFPQNLEEAVSHIKQALKDSLIRQEDIDQKCRKILLAKYQYVSPRPREVRTESLWSRLNTTEDFALKQELYKQAITLIKNEADLLPLKRLDTLRLACVNFGGKKLNHFQTTLDYYEKIEHFQTGEKPSVEEINELVKKLTSYNCVILYNSKASNLTSRNFGYTPRLAQLIGQLKGKRIILCHPGIPYGLKSYVDLPIDALLINYEDHLYSRQYAAQAIFGGIPVNGRLPVEISPAYPAGSGISTPKTRLGYSIPEMCGLSSGQLEAIDSLCKRAIQVKATPGCQVLVAKNGYIVYNKAFGYHTYVRQTPNKTTNIYDVASVTKIAATLPAVMKLYDEGILQLDAPLARYYPALQETDKKNITVKEVLTHTAGLKPIVPSFTHAIDKKALSGQLFTVRPTPQNSLKLKNRLYANPNYHFRDSTLSRKPLPDYEPLSPGLYICKTYRDTTICCILNSELNPKKEYIYSDLGFILLQKAIENLTGKTLDHYCWENFFQKIGAYNTVFEAAKRFNASRIIPSSVDKLYRKTEIKGYVHDPTAALLGGVAGHAGLFSTAEDLAKIMAIYLNQGCYGGERFFSPSTVRLFTQKTDFPPTNRRGLGFDKPETDTTKNSPACKSAPACSFGHTGFTGTMVWADPSNELIYVFLSNRTYPNEFNTKLTEESIRTKIQEIIYKAIRKPAPVPLQ